MQRKASQKKTAKKRRGMRNGKTLLWLLLCFPVGLTKMWRSSCTWHVGVKYAVSSIVLVALAAVMLYPSPYQKPETGIRLIGEKPTAKIYGPEIPEDAVIGYSQMVTTSVIAPEIPEEDVGLIVYAAKDQDCYHLSTCKFAYASAQHLSVYEAQLLGYTPCGLCNPPIQ